MLDLLSKQLVQGWIKEVVREVEREKTKTIEGLDDLVKSIVKRCGMRQLL